MRRFVPFTVIALVLGLPRPAHADFDGTITVRVKSTKADGEAWDVAGGAPDIEMCLITPANRTCDRTKNGKQSDTFRAVFSQVIPHGNFTVYFYDADLSSDDAIGTASCVADKGEVECALSGQLDGVKVRKAE